MIKNLSMKSSSGNRALLATVFWKQRDVIDAIPE
jgi:hypothetical protein